ncbi:type II toxin-antitoxin system VapC family toxin [Micromonospora aurantiaca (nom. illeg.)]
MDTGPLVALINEKDSYHTSCVAWLESALGRRRPLVIPIPVITEVCYLLSTTAGSAYEARFLEELAQVPSAFSLFTPGREDLGRMGALVRKYSDLPLGSTDACVIATAERFKTNEIATIDDRMVKVVRVNDRDPIVAVP